MFFSIFAPIWRAVPAFKRELLTEKNNTETMMKKHYTTPEVEVIDLAVEQGFAASMEGLDEIPLP